MQAPPPQPTSAPPPPPLTKHQTNCYPYHEMETINSNSNGIHECVVSELMFHKDDDDSSNIIDNNNNDSNSLLPLPRLMEVQENGTTYNNSCCFTTTSSSQEISSLSSPPSYSLGTSTYAVASSNWSDNAVVIGEEVLGFLVEFGSKPPPPSSSLSSYSNDINNNYALLNGFDYHEKLIMGTDDDQEIHIPSTSNSNLVNYSYSSTSTLLDNISENEPAAGLRHH